LVTSHTDAECIVQALTFGVNGHHVESSFSDRLVQAMRNAGNGGAPMRGSTVLKLAQYFHDLGVPPKKDKNLSPRERQIIDLLALGLIYKEIGIKLNISAETVRSHVKSIYEKLNVRNRTEAIAKYRK